MKYPYEEIKEENEIELRNNPYFSVILRKKKINSLYKLIYNEMLITSILEQKMQSIILIQSCIRSNYYYNI
jgi:hypothetical protein